MGFPKVLYVTEEKDGPIKYYQPETRLDGHARIGQIITVAEYKLVKVLKVKTKVEAA